MLNTQKGVNVMQFLFNPLPVAVIGASDNPTKLGFHIMKSLVNGGFKGTLIPVNPGADEIFGFKTYPSMWMLFRVSAGS